MAADAARDAGVEHRAAQGALDDGLVLMVTALGLLDDGARGTAGGGSWSGARIAAAVLAGKVPAAPARSS